MARNQIQAPPGQGRAGEHTRGAPSVAAIARHPIHPLPALLADICYRPDRG